MEAMRMRYKIFKRKWWKNNPSWPNGLEPDGSARKTTLGYADSESEAVDYCRTWNLNNNPGRFSIKAEFEGC